MKRKTRFSVITLCLALLCTAALTGCLRFENSMNLNTPVTAGADNTAPGISTADTEPSGAFVTEPMDESTALPEDEPGTTLPDGSTEATQPNQPTQTAVPGESTTAGTQESTTAAGPLSPAEAARSLGTTEYDTLRSNAFTISAELGEANGEETPAEMSIDDGRLYMVSEIEGMQMGIYVEGKKTYIYMPKQKKYLKLNNAVAKMMGIDPNEFSDMAADMGFDALPALTEAKSVSNGTMNGKACQIFLLKGKDGADMRVGLNGKKLIGIEYLTATGGVESYMYFNSVTAGFPAMPPSGYSEMGYMDFVKLMMAEMDEG